MWRYDKKFCLLILCCFLLSLGGTAQRAPASHRTLSVSDGVPQSFISGLVQDPQGFIWMATRDGLAKYDGRKFKVFRNDHRDKRTVAANIINNLYLDQKGRLWIAYEEGEIDLLDTNTERITHLTDRQNFRILRGVFKTGKSIIAIGEQIFWMLGRNGKIYILNLQTEHVKVLTANQLLPSLPQTFITGLAKTSSKNSSQDQIILTTDSALVYMSVDKKVVDIVPYQFTNSALYNPKRSWKDNSPIVRNNGDLIIFDENRLIIYHARTREFEVVALPFAQYYVVFPRVMDRLGNIFFSHGGTTYYLSTANRLARFNEVTNHQEKQVSLLLDKSGVLWEGTNGYGIRQHDLYLKQMPQVNYTATFQEDILKLLKIPSQNIANTFLAAMSPYFFRWVKNDGKIWMSKAGADSVTHPNLAYYQNGELTSPQFNYLTSTVKKRSGIDALASDGSGRLWGIDHNFHPILLDTKNQTAQVFDSIPYRFNAGQIKEINGMVIDGTDTFWISTSLGLVKYHMPDKRLRHFFHNGKIRHIMTMIQDPEDQDILWLGAYTEGLIRFEKKTAKASYFTMKEGLPNNTVYAIMADKNGVLWCSTNKGIFAFHPKTKKVSSYVIQGDTRVDEFNRFHFFKFPSGQMAFGGTEGYTFFDPYDFPEDAFQPKIVLTGIKINNQDADYGSSQAQLDSAINSLKSLTLPYDKNFLSFEFSAMQYNIPGKLNYRHQLIGLDKDWVTSEKENTATYSAIPPGRYTLVVNASNTAGKWSKFSKTLQIEIVPPFWGTWWFKTMLFVLIILLILVTVRLRISIIRREEKKKIQFERETMELEARALRAQMNPHFIFNCLNSIKALIQEDEKRKAVVYLTTFSRLIRHQLHNNHREISLHEELETCKLYLQLEALRFENKLTYKFIEDDSLDLHQIKVPPLLLQPFIENAIFHGILPLEKDGRIIIKVATGPNGIVCIIDDNGIGRQAAQLDRLKRRPDHVSKGMQLVEDRLNLHNNLNFNNIKIEIMDKTDSNDRALGTCVTVIFDTTL